MEECIAREEVYRLLFMSPLTRNISACADTRSAGSRLRTWSTLALSTPHSGGLASL